MATTHVLGIPVPSTDPLFLFIVGVHILFGLSAVMTGLAAMLQRKERGRHSAFGTAYFWSLFGVFVTMAALSLVRWAEDYALFLLGALAFAAAYFGRAAIRRRLPHWHLAGMATSYILLLTAFYVDNGRNLPLWKELPPIAYWTVPGMIGLPLTLWYLLRLPQFKL